MSTQEVQYTKFARQTLAFAEELVKASTSKELSSLQKAVLRGGLANSTYDQIAAASRYSRIWAVMSRDRCGIDGL